MATIDALLSQPMVQRLGWALLHFVWQGAIVAILLAGVLFVLRRRSANARYVAACLALLLMATLPVATFQFIPTAGQQLPILSKVVSLPPAPSGPEGLPRIKPVDIPKAPPGLPPGIEDRNSSRSRLVRDWYTSALDALETRLPLIVGLWCVGVVVLSFWHVGGWVQVQRIRRRWVEPAAEQCRILVGNLAGRIGLRQGVQVCTSPRLSTPSVVGWLRPVILLPVSAVTGLSPGHLEAILAHELAHIRRHDYLVNLIQTIIETFLFYHPAVWWVSRRIRVEREYCCDDLAVAATGSVISYARALAGLEELRAVPARAAVAMAATPLLDRIRRLAGLGSHRARRSPISMATAICLTLLLAVGTGWFVKKTTAQEKQDSSSEAVSVLREPFKVGDVLVYDIRFEPIQQGKNILYVDFQNLSNNETVFSLGLYAWTGSANWGRGGSTWSKRFSRSLGAQAKASLRSAYHIPGPVSFWTTVSVSLDPSVSDSRTPDANRGSVRRSYYSQELPVRKPDEIRPRPVALSEEKAVIRVLEAFQKAIASGNNLAAWQLLSEDYRKAEYGGRFEAFVGALEARTGATVGLKNDLVSLDPDSLGQVAQTFKLNAMCRGHCWTLDFIRDGSQLRIDWITGLVVSNTSYRQPEEGELVVEPFKVPKEAERLKGVSIRTKATAGLRSLHMVGEPAFTFVRTLKEAWVEFDEQGTLIRVRMDFDQSYHGPKVVIWRGGKAEIWFKGRKQVLMVPVPDILSHLSLEAKAMLFNPSLVVDRLFVWRATGEATDFEMQRGSPGHPITLTLTTQGGRYWEKYIFDPKSHLPFLFEQHENMTQDGSKKRILWERVTVDYNKPFDRTVFNPDYPPDVVRIDQTTGDVGLVGDATAREDVAAKVVQDFFEALRQKDYVRAGKLHGGLSPEDVRTRFGRQDVRHVVSVERAGPSAGRPGASVKVVCKVEVAEAGATKVVEFVAKVQVLYNQPGRWAIEGWESLPAGLR